MKHFSDTTQKDKGTGDTSHVVVERIVLHAISSLVGNSMHSCPKFSLRVLHRRNLHIS